MTRRLLLCSLLGALPALARLPSPRHKIRFDGVGPLRVGMAEPALRKILGLSLRIETHDSGVYATWGDPDLGLVLVDGKLARIDVAGGRWRTIGGTRVGSLEADVRDVFKQRIETRSHSFDPRGRVLLVRSKLYALAFETDGDIVTALRAGLLSAV